MGAGSDRWCLRQRCLFSIRVAVLGCVCFKLAALDIAWIAPNALGHGGGGGGGDSLSLLRHVSKPIRQEQTRLVSAFGYAPSANGVAVAASLLLAAASLRRLSLRQPRRTRLCGSAATTTVAVHGVAREATEAPFVPVPTGDVEAARVTASASLTPTLSQTWDVVVVGAGPAGSLVAHLLAERHDKKVCLVDPRASAPWPNNYGVWLEEWEALESKLMLGLDNCLDCRWPVTDCFLGGSWNVPMEKLSRLERAYGRVDRTRLKARLQSERVHVIEDALESRLVFSSKFGSDSIQHDAEGTTLQLVSGKTLRSRLVIDATGFESRLTRRVPRVGESGPPDPGYQIAYGFECIVDGPTHYDIGAMTLFDYRTDHLSFDPSWEERARTHPTFLYAMPLGPVPEEGVSGQRFFFEETSLVGRPAMSFQECKDRLFARLSHLGITVRPCSIKDEEFCNIPMGGPLPEPGQRVIAFGGAAALVHPSTGYHLCRMMAAAKELTDAVGEALANPADLSPDAVASLAYDAIWSPPKQVQRDFAVFGGEFLMSLGVEELRGWFDSFFRLPIPLWGGFLAGWPTLPGNQLHETWFSRFVFGLQIVTKLPVPVALELIKSITVYTMIHGNSLLRSVTPFFGQPQSYRLSA